MLKEIFCDKFLENGVVRPAIKFHEGLNSIIGGKEGDNSIGKSTFLMIIDFVFGGNDYTHHLRTIRKHVGDHVINFTFEFNNKLYYFSRATDTPNEVSICNSNYEQTSTLKLSQYLEFLKYYYGCCTTFRDTVSPFIRVYQRDTTDEERPLKTHSGSPRDELLTLIRIFNRYDEIGPMLVELKDMDNHLSNIAGAQNDEIIMNVKGDKEYDSNTVQIEELKSQLQDLSNDLKLNVASIDSIKDSQFLALKEQLKAVQKELRPLQADLKSIENNGQPDRRISKNDIDELRHFFPNANIREIEDINKFHKNISTIVKSESDELRSKLSSKIEYLNARKFDLKTQIRELGISNSLNEEALKSIITLSEQIRDLERGNEYYTKHQELKDKTKSFKKDVNAEIMSCLEPIGEAINEEMKRMNGEIYPEIEKTSPEIKFLTASSYLFEAVDDSGTGSQYRSLIEFDMAMINLTGVPFLVHDSFMFKNIENDVVDAIMELYGRTSKQIFIAFDKLDDYHATTQKMINDAKVLKLSAGGGELFGSSFNIKK